MGEFSKILLDLGEALPEDIENEIFAAADHGGDGKVDFDDFVMLMIKYCNGETSIGNGSVAAFREQTMSIAGGAVHSRGTAAGEREASSLHRQLLEGDGEEEGDSEEEEFPEDLQGLSPSEQQKAVKLRAFWMMGVGTVLVLIFADPAVEVLNEIGKRTGVPSFYISFILAPLASNASELVATYKYAAKKTKNSMTIGLSTLLGAACMNNTFCLAIFYCLVYFQQLVWKFTAEIMVIVLVQFVVGAVAMKPVMKLRDAVIILACYPASLLFVWTLNNIFGIE